MRVGRGGEEREAGGWGWFWLSEATLDRVAVARVGEAVVRFRFGTEGGVCLGLGSRFRQR